jgi:hypothetical protein
MLSSTNPTKRPMIGAFGLATGVVASCMTFTSLAQAQDECASATAAVVGVNAFNTTTATASANPPADALCTGTFLNWLATQQDVWFSYTPGQTGSLSLTTCLAGSYDTSMALYEGTSCGTAALIACNGDDPAASGSCQAFYSTISNVQTSDTATYYIRIGGYEGATGAGELTLSFVASQFPACLNSTDPCGEVHVGIGCSDTACCEAVCATYPFCCEETWDSTCVDIAVDTCGIFSYECTGGGPANDCATAAAVVTDGAVVNFNTASANTDGPNEAGCNSADADLPIWFDVWYRFVAPANGFATATNCNTAAFDSKIAFYELPGTFAEFVPQDLPEMFVACNEDCPEDAVNYTSSQTIPVVIGRTYLVRLGGFAGQTGSGTIAFDLPDPCSLPSTGASENEVCGESINPGCGDDKTSIVTTTLVPNIATGGSFWADADTRDTDWYQLSIGSASSVTIDVWSASNTAMFLFSGSPCDLDNLILLGEGGATACPSSLTACLNPGVYYLFVALPDFNGTPCGSGAFNNYVVKATTTPATCPVLLDTVCDNPGPDNLTINNSNATNFGIVQCGVAGPTGYSVESWFARRFLAGTVDSGEIRCVTFGIANFQYVTTTTIQNSDISQSGTLEIYTDNNGGNPVNVQGATQDLTLIAAYPFNAPGGFYAASLTLDVPLCLDGNTQNIVIVAHLDQVEPNNAGYRLACAGNQAGPLSETFVMFPACGAGFADFVAYDTGNRQWYVSINGDFSSCGNNCPADFNNDGTVDGADLGSLLGEWGACPGCIQDLNDDDVVDGADLGGLLGEWGACD